MELKDLLEHHISEEKRNKMISNFKKAKEEHKSGKLRFSSKIDELKEMI